VVVAKTVSVAHRCMAVSTIPPRARSQ
jgi:hypothetical protein